MTLPFFFGEGEYVFKLSLIYDTFCRVLDLGVVSKDAKGSWVWIGVI
jgi:hypothetical protein